MITTNPTTYHPSPPALNLLLVSSLGGEYPTYLLARVSVDGGHPINPCDLEPKKLFRSLFGGDFVGRAVTRNRNLSEGIHPSNLII